MSKRPYSHIYIEEPLLGTARVERILHRFPHSSVIAITDYRQLFLRPRQEWRLQKDSPKLILAKRRAEFLYPGSPVTPHFGFDHFFYNTLALNCFYDCSYCYLQGMLPSANMVLFLNIEDYVTAALHQLKLTTPMYLCLSYDTDLLPLESLVPYSRLWLDVVRRNSALTVELRTKSAAFHFLRDQPACDRFVIAWTLTPQSAIDRFERNAPSLQARLAALKRAIESGWRVRICLDPILAFPGWQTAYRELVQELGHLPEEGILDISVGALRMSRDHWSRFSEIRPDHPALGATEPQGKYVAAPPSHLKEALTLVRSALSGTHAAKVFPSYSMPT